LNAILDTGPLPDDTVRFLLSAFDTDGNGIISFEELERAWLSWFGEASKPVHALIIIDVQNDFIDGTLGLKHCPAGQDGAAVVPVINKLRSSVPFDAVAISLDWHPHEHCSFHEVVTAGQSPAPLHPSQA
jgi:exosome complex component RRP4